MADMSDFAYQPPGQGNAYGPDNNLRDDPGVGGYERELVDKPGGGVQFRQWFPIRGDSLHGQATGDSGIGPRPKAALERLRGP
jgi:hypothetical protein